MLSGERRAALLAWMRRTDATVVEDDYEFHGTAHAPIEPHAALARYGADGVLYGRRQPGRVRPGNCCLTVAQPYKGPSL